jgi:hypothetical protein
MPFLHLGVAQIFVCRTTGLCYAAAWAKRRENIKGRRKNTEVSQTTGDVAETLENKYHIMEHFYQGA